MVPPASHKVSRVSWYSGTGRAVFSFTYRTVTFFGSAFQPYSARYLRSLLPALNPEHPKTFGLGSSPFARRYLENRSFFLFLRLLRCFSSPGSLLADYVFISRYWPMKASGFPHSDIHESRPACGYSWLFAAYHVLLRLLMPRHSPYALLSLIFFPKTKNLS